MAALEGFCRDWVEGQFRFSGSVTMWFMHPWREALILISRLNFQLPVFGQVIPWLVICAPYFGLRGESDSR